MARTLIALTLFAISLIWSIPLQWIVIRRSVERSGPALLAAETAFAVIVSGVLGGAPVLFLCGSLAEVAAAIGMGSDWIDRIFIRELRMEWVQVAFLLGWIGVAWLSTSAVEALLLKRIWRKSPSKSPWSVAWRANGVAYVGIAALAVALARNP